jgi:hypothetical protein
MSSPVHELCHAYVERLVAADPAITTQLGLFGQNAELTDYSPEASTSGRFRSAT